MIEVALLNFLKADVSLTEKLGSRLYPLAIPQQPTYPGLAYQFIDGVEDLTHSGYSGLTIARYQLTLVDTSYLRLLQTEQALKARLYRYNNYKYSDFNGMLGEYRVDSIRLEDGPDQFEPTSKEYRRSVDVIIAYALAP